MESYLMVLVVFVWCSIVNGEKNELNEEVERIIMKGISNFDADKIRHCETKKVMLDILQCLYEGEISVVIEEFDEPCCLSSEPESMNVVDNEKKRSKKCWLTGS